MADSSPAVLVRYARLLGLQMRASLLLTLQYRVDFLVDLALSILATGTALVPLLVLYDDRAEVAGWSWAEALLVVGYFNVLRGVLNALIHPSLQAVVEHIRKGTLDFVLIKPADAQFLVSTARFDLRELSDSIAGLLIVGYGMWELGRVPSLAAALAAAVLLACGAAILYAIFIMVVALAFVVVRVDNLSYLFMSLFDAARWPASVFRGGFALLFTFVLPLALMTTYPALALLDKLDARGMITPLLVATLFLAVARRVWLACVRRYTSAGG